jgi:hypothetical protein
MWTILYSGPAKRALKKGRKILSQDALDAMDMLHLDLEMFGPSQTGWPNYGKLKNQGKGVDRRHCHLLKGRPTFVACWEVKNTKNKILEVYYVGTHEKAPY